MLLYAAFVALSCWFEGPTRPGVNAGRFDVTRAWSTLSELGEAPRRIGSPGAAAARSYLRRRLETMAYEVTEQSSTVVQTRFQNPARGEPARLATVHNLVARRRGASPPPEAAVLLSAHYDTRSMTPGMGDDGIGVAVVLEVARILGEGPPPPREVLFLLTDGEEEGLLGAHAFVTEHPWSRGISAVVNVDARGDRGASLLFQTSEPVSSALDLADKSGAPLVTNSLLTAVYRRMPNDTDLSEWLPRGVVAFNLANVEGFERYHAPTDTLANLSRDTLAHHGENVLALATVLSRAEKMRGEGQREVFFTAWGRLVRYSATTAHVLLAGSVLALIGLFSRFGRGRSPRGLVREMVGMVSGLLLVLGVALVLRHAASLVVSDAMAAAIHPLAKTSLFMAHGLLGVSVALFVRALFRTGALGGTLFACLLCGTVTMVFLEGSYLFQIPWIAMLAAHLLPPRWRPLWGLVLAALWGPFLWLVAAAFGPKVGPVFAVLAYTVTLLLLVHEEPHAQKRALLWAPLFAAGFMLVACVVPKHSRSYPEPGSLFCLVDQGRGEAFWASGDLDPPPWVAARVGRESALPPEPWAFTKVSLRRQRASMPKKVPIRITKIPSETGLVLHVDAETETELLRLETEGSTLTRATVNGVLVPLKPNGSLSLAYSAPPPSGVQLVLETQENVPITLSVAAQTPGLCEPAPPPVGFMHRSGTIPPYDELLEGGMTVTLAQARF